MKMFHYLFPVAMNSAALAGRGVYLNILFLKVTSLPVIYPFVNYELRVKVKQPIIIITVEPLCIPFTGVSFVLLCSYIHSYCLFLGSYLNVKIKEGKAHGIQCPAFDCSALVPVVSEL